MKLLVAAALLVFSAGAADDGFAAWFPQFQEAVARGNPKAIAALAHFPLEWELGTVRKIDSQTDFLANFPSYFPVDLRKAVARTKPQTIPDGYMLTWKARGNEYSLYFKKIEGRFRLDGLSEGPP